VRGGIVYKQTLLKLRSCRCNGKEREQEWILLAENQFKRRHLELKERLTKLKNIMSAQDEYGRKTNTTR
jgi:hypothetical protein